MDTKSEEINVDAAVEQWVQIVLAHIEAKKQKKGNSAPNKNNEHLQ